MVKFNAKWMYFPELIVQAYTYIKNRLTTVLLAY